jgi:hypothetical protein
VLVICVCAIYLALLTQFKHAFKATHRIAAILYGINGAVIALAIMGQPFGFIAFLGIISLIGVIVSHSIVLFEFIEERREAGEDLELALIDAGILRLRPVMITVLYSFVVLDLKLIRWEQAEPKGSACSEKPSEIPAISGCMRDCFEHSRRRASTRTIASMLGSYSEVRSNTSIAIESSFRLSTSPSIVRFTMCVRSRHNLVDETNPELFTIRAN